MVDKEKVATPRYEEFELLIQNQFNILCTKRHALKRSLIDIEAEVKRLDDQLNPLMGAIGQSSVRVGNLTVKRVDSTSPSKLDKQLLLEHGVAADTIAECTVPGKPYSYVQTVEDKQK